MQMLQFQCILFDEISSSTFSFQGKQHPLGARIQLPEKCSELVCVEGLIAPDSTPLAGAVQHNISHPEELTLEFRTVHWGSECCILPFAATTSNGSIYTEGTMVAEGNASYKFQYPSKLD